MRQLTWACAALVAAGAVVAPLQAQAGWERSGEGWCDDDWGGRDSDRHCHVRVATFDAVRALVIDGGLNGGVNVEGWSGDEIEVRAKVHARARSEARAREIAEEIRIVFQGGRLSADGPRSFDREGWGVSFEVRVPYATDLDIETHNGGIGVSGVEGDIRFHALNGGVHLTEVAGDVRGQTTNGGLHVELDGDRWQGSGLDVSTVNGGVKLYIPENFSGELVTGTVNGGIDIDFPVTVRGRIGKELRTTLGEGGPMIRATTTNGGVKVARGGASVRR